MKSAVLCFIFLIAVMSSCSTYSIHNTDKNIKGLNIGMTQDQIISVMGKDYNVLEATNEFVVWGYKSLDDGIYRLTFVDGRLTEWKKIWLNKYEDDKKRVS